MAEEVAGSCILIHDNWITTSLKVHSLIMDMVSGAW